LNPSIQAFADIDFVSPFAEAYGAGVDDMTRIQSSSETLAVTCES